MSPCKNLFIRTPQTDKTLVLQLEDVLSLKEFKERLHEITGIPVDSQKLLVSGKFISSCKFETGQIANNSTVEIYLGVGGGKGGFGSLLRNQAIIRRRTTNTDACRDLNGRRVRNVSYEAQLLDHLKKKSEEDKRIKKELDAYKKQEAMIKHAQYDIKLNQDYKNKIEKWDLEMAHSIKKGIGKKIEGAEKRISESNLEELSNETLDFPVPRRKIAHSGENSTALEKSAKGPLNDLPVESILKEIGFKENLPGDQSIPEEGVQDSEKDAKVEKKSKPSFDSNNFNNIDLTKFDSEEQLEALGPDHLKHELTRLGLKCGGTLKERAKRLMEIKKDPANLFNPKLLASKK